MEIINITGRIYVSTFYSADSNGLLTADLPVKCPLPPKPDEPCNIVCHHFRNRKTGPCISLLVAHCHTHKKSFTIYPPGHVPYGRKPILPLAPDESACIHSIGKERFTGTIFDAALDAADAKPWTYHYQSEKTWPFFNTQSSHIQQALALLGISPDSDQTGREVVARVLRVPGQVLHDSAQMTKQAPFYLHQGKAIVSILDAIAPSNFLFERLALLGSMASLWPPLFFWDPHRGCYREHSFRNIGTRAPPP